MTDSDAPEGDDIWSRLRRLDDLVPADDPPAADPGGAPADTPGSGGGDDAWYADLPDATRVAPVVEPPAPDPASGGGDGAGGGGQYFVPAPGAAPASAPRPPTRPVTSQPSPRRAADAYRTSMPAAPAPGPAAPPPPSEPPARRDRGRDRPARRRKPWYRPKLRWIVLYLPLLVILLLGGVLLWGWNAFNDLYRVDLGDSLRPAAGNAVNYLIVGSDTREGIDPNDPNIGVIGTGSEVSGRRSDTLIILRVDGDSAQMMSVPRDLWVTNAATGKKGRINGTYAQGPSNLVDSITANLGIPINRYIEVDFVSFAGMVDAMGGIDIEFPHPVIDPNSGLRIGTAGVHRLDGSMALAYVRSRHYTEEIDGKPRLEPTADLGRQQRQQTFIRTVLRTVGDTRNPLTLARVGSAAAKGVRVDDEVGFGDLVSLARQLSGVEPETKVLPTEGATKGGASVLVLKDAEALPILAEFGAGG